jgi:hypothetical protein
MNNKALSVVMLLPSGGQIYGMGRPEGNRGVGYGGAAKLAFFVAQLGCQIDLNGNRSMQQVLAYDLGKILR